MNKEIEFEIVKEIAILSKNQNDYTKEINLVKWNKAEAKYDIRNWSPNREKSLKGISLSVDETKALYEALKREFDR